ncbi:MAG TPA: dihydrolipoyl dehydrogenase [Terriglobales bacterium]|nr:dihydrolipoyl dehydrogenase [Terriglobales bacterium]
MSKNIAVVGGGPGGYAAAFYAADLGMQVTLIDEAVNPGGVCLYVGCIPSKALLHVAALINEAEHAKAWGVEFSKPNIDLNRLRDFKNSVVNRLTGGLGQLSKQRKVNYVRGRAGFVNSNTLNVRMAEGGEQKLSFDNIILATGSRPAMIPGVPPSQRIMDSTAALELRDIPKTLLVIGGGYIGLELGTVYAALGTKVTVVEMLPQILTGADRDLVNPLAKRLEKKFSSIMLNTKVVEMKETADGIKVRLDGPNLAAPEQTFEKVLISVGRKPNTDIEGLDKTRVTKVQRGFIETDLQRRTKDPVIFAIGDIAGEPMLAHKASHEGRVAVEAIAGKKTTFEPRAIPAVVFTDPEIAWCGLTETEAQAKNIPVKVSRFPWAASGRAVTLDRIEGVTKLVIDPETERVLGLGICGPNAGEMISEGVLAVEMSAVVDDLSLTIHPHPTLSETIMEVAEAYHNVSTHIYRPKRG